MENDSDSYKDYTHEQLLENRDRDIYRARVREDIKIMNETLSNKIKDEIDVILNFNKKYKIVKNDNADNRFYYFRFVFQNKKYYKLGITSQTLQERYGGEYLKIDKVLYDKKIDGAIKLEKLIKKEYQNNIFPLKFFNDSGHTEIFSDDILKLDDEK